MSPRYQSSTDAKHSYQIQQIIHRVPHWLLKWGNSLLLLLIVSLAGIGWMIRYPTVVHASFTLTSGTRPKAVKARVNGTILRLFVHESQPVKAGQVLGYIESTADPDEVMSLSSVIDQLCKDSVTMRNEELPVAVNGFQNLGTIQPSFQNFIASYRQYKASLDNGYYNVRLRLLKDQLAELQALENNYERQQADYQHDYDLSVQNFQANQTLAEEKVIAPLELKQAESRLLSKKVPLRDIQSQLLQNKDSQIEKQKEINELGKFIGDQKSSFLQAIHLVRSDIDNWKLSYVLSAPLDGKINFSTFIQEHQNVTNGEELLYIASRQGEQMEYGEALIPQDNSGKVRVGQAVMIKFRGYPFREYGYVKGKISFISKLPAHDSSFLAKIELPDGLTTNYHKTLLYKDGMMASAEIITEDARLLQRLLHSFRGIQ